MTERVVAWVPVAKEPVGLVGQDDKRPDDDRVIVVTDPHTHTHPQTGPITIHCATAS